MDVVDHDRVSCQVYIIHMLRTCKACRSVMYICGGGFPFFLRGRLMN